MGLDAVVYSNRDHLEVNDEKDLKYSEDIFTAIHKRLGNLEAIAFLRKEISNVIGNKSILYTKVLYEGSHSGDVIGLENLAALESELDQIAKATGETRSVSLTNFLVDMRELIQMARKEKNPIVFV